MKVWVEGRAVALDPCRSVGKGGEADVFDIGKGQALKLFKRPEHPDLAASPSDQEMARRRLEEMQTKLRSFPGNLPPSVVSPGAVATDRAGRRILGYTMRLVSGAELLLRYGERTFRSGGLGNGVVFEVFRDLHASVAATHQAGVVIGDFNDLNVLVAGRSTFLVDADSFQFGPYLCKVFTERFVDPLLCDPNATRPILVRPHTADSDWYAFSLMLMRSLLFVDPYGGVYRPADRSRRIPHAARPLSRVTVFHPDVQYPKVAERPDILPDDLLSYFERVFVKDERGEFPLRLLEATNWTRCLSCGAEHARSVCPFCIGSTPAAVKQTVVVRGRVTVTRIFRTEGAILRASSDSGHLLCLALDRGALVREDGSAVPAQAVGSNSRIRLRPGVTFVGRSGRVVEHRGASPRGVAAADVAERETMFDSNEHHVYWVENGQLLRDGSLGPERIGFVLERQTNFWAGPRFGFGFYRAGEMSVAFVFDARSRGINDGVQIPPLKGQLLWSRCAFTDDLCWFVSATREAGRTIRVCAVIRRDGRIEGMGESEEGDGSWLSSFRGQPAAAGSSLLVATDAGIVRVEVGGGKIAQAADFPDTEPFVDEETDLLAVREGLAAVGPQEISILRIDPPASESARV